MFFNIYDIFLDLMLLYSFTSLTYRFWPFPINRIIGGLTIIVLLTSICKRLTKKRVVLLIVILLCTIFSFILAEDYSKNATDAIYWINTLLCLVTFSNEIECQLVKSSIHKQVKAIQLVILVENLIVIIGFFINECYVVDAWGGHIYYGFGHAPHSVCSALCLMMALTIAVQQEKKSGIMLILMLVPGSLAILQSGSRSFLIAVIIMWVICFVYFIQSKSLLKILIVPLILVVFIFAFINSGMMHKMQLQVTFSNLTANINNRSVVENITSGRLNIWKLDINTFKNSGIVRMLIGNGFDYVYKVNELYYGMDIWSHNDFIDLLLSVGIIGTIFYIYVLYYSLIYIKKKKKSLVIFILLASYLLFEMLLNGLFPYQNYLYSYIVLLCFANKLNTMNNIQYCKFENKMNKGGFL